MIDIITAKELARMDYVAALTLRENNYSMFKQVICFHLQQAIEKYLKRHIQSNHFEVPKIHKVGELCGYCSNLGLYIPDVIRQYAGSLDYWQYASRYHVDFKASDNIIDAMFKVCAYLDQQVQ